MADEPTFNGNNRNPDGTFAVGNPGGPGRPLGSVSIVAKIKKKFEENPQYFDEWVNKLMEDPKERRAIMEQIDGNPLTFKFAKRKESQLKRVARINALRKSDQDEDDWDIKDITGKKQATIYDWRTLSAGIASVAVNNASIFVVDIGLAALPPGSMPTGRWNLKSIWTEAGCTGG